MINLKLRINDKSEIIIKEYKTKKFTEDDVRVYMKIGLLKILVAEDSWKYEIYPTLHYILNNIQEYDEELINTNFYNMEDLEKYSEYVLFDLKHQVLIYKKTDKVYLELRRNISGKVYRFELSSVTVSNWIKDLYKKMGRFASGNNEIHARWI